MSIVIVTFMKNESVWESTTVFCPNQNVMNLLNSLEGKYNFDTFALMLKKVFEYYLENFSGTLNSFLSFLLQLDRQIKNEDVILVHLTK